MDTWMGYFKLEWRSNAENSVFYVPVIRLPLCLYFSKEGLLNHCKLDLSFRSVVLHCFSEEKDLE